MTNKKVKGFKREKSDYGVRICSVRWGTLLMINSRFSSKVFDLCDRSLRRWNFSLVIHVGVVFCFQNTAEIQSHLD